jgi:hypothetical protein
VQGLDLNQRPSGYDSNFYYAITYAHSQRYRQGVCGPDLVSTKENMALDTIEKQDDVLKLFKIIYLIPDTRDINDIIASS